MKINHLELDPKMQQTTSEVEILEVFDYLGWSLVNTVS